MIPTVEIHVGDCRELLRRLKRESVQCCVTSPPYFGLRDYGIAGQLGAELTAAEYVAKMVKVFREVRRVLKPDGTLWLNLGDSYAGGGNGGGGSFAKNGIRQAEPGTDKNKPIRKGKRGADNGLKPKDLIGIPWRVAFALQRDGWWLRQFMPWIKRNPMPESTQDRPVVSCETFFLLTKSDRYFYDAEAIKLPGSMALQKQVEEGYSGKATKDFALAGAQDASAVKSRIIAGKRKSDKQRGHSRKHAGFNERWDAMEKEDQCSGWRSTRNSDWFFESLAPLLLDDRDLPLAFVVNPKGFEGAHFATYPPQLIKPCILAGSRPGDVIIDPFGGSGTTGQVSLELGRSAVLLELNPEYAELARRRCAVTPALAL